MQVAYVGRMKNTASIFLSGISNHALSAEKLPEELKLLRWGQNDTALGVFVVNDRTLEAIKAQCSGNVYNHVTIDFEHNSEPRHQNYQPPPRKHAGVGEPHCSEDQGLCLLNCVWTPSGEEYGRDYPDVSPSLIYDKVTREVLGLSSVGLCPNGAVHGLSFFAAERPNPENNNQDKETNMTLEELAAQMAAMQETLAGLRSEIDAIKPNAEIKVTPDDIPDIKPLEEKIAALKEDVQASTARTEKEMMMAIARHEGKAVGLSNEAVAALSATDLRAHLDGLKPTVPLTQKTKEGEDQHGTVTLSATQKMLAAQLGLKEPEKVFV